MPGRPYISSLYNCIMGHVVLIVWSSHVGMLVVSSLVYTDEKYLFRVDAFSSSLMDVTLSTSSSPIPVLTLVLLLTYLWKVLGFVFAVFATSFSKCFIACLVALLAWFLALQYISYSLPSLVSRYRLYDSVFFLTFASAFLFIHNGFLLFGFAMSTVRWGIHRCQCRVSLWLQSYPTDRWPISRPSVTNPVERGIRWNLHSHLCGIGYFLSGWSVVHSSSLSSIAVLRGGSCRWAGCVLHVRVSSICCCLQQLQ